MANFDPSIFEDDANELQNLVSSVPSKVGLIGDYLKERQDLLSRIENLESDLATAKKDLEILEVKTIPNFLDSIGQSSLTTSEGLVVELENQVFAGISEENRPRAYDWLRETSNEGIIKNEVSLKFGKGEDEKAKELKEALELLGYSDFDEKQSIHGSTLKKFVKDQLEAERMAVARGEVPQPECLIPRDLFGVHEVRRVKVTVAKNRRK